MAISSSLKSALKSSELVVRHYVAQLESDNAKLQKQIAKLEAKNIEQKQKISALQKEFKNGPVHKFQISRVIVDPAKSLSDAELERIARGKP